MKKKNPQNNTENHKNKINKTTYQKTKPTNQKLPKKPQKETLWAFFQDYIWPITFQRQF